MIGKTTGGNGDADSWRAKPVPFLRPPGDAAVRPASRADSGDHDRQRPGKLNYGSAGIGTLQHVWGTILVKNLGLDMVHVPYKSGPAAEQDLIAGRLELMFDNLSAVKQFIDAGQL